MSIAGTTRGAAVHWNGLNRLGLISCTGDRCERVWANIRAYHIREGWIDVAYNHGLCPGCGRRLDGRGWGVRSGANGTTAANREWHALMVMVGGDEPFTDTAKRGVLEYHAEHHRRYGRSTLTYHQAVRGGGTACAGAVINSWVRSGAAKPPQPLDEEDDMARSGLARISNGDKVYDYCGHALVRVKTRHQAAIAVWLRTNEPGTAAEIAAEHRWQQHVANLSRGEANHLTIIENLDGSSGDAFTWTEADERYARRSHGHAGTVEVS